MVRGKMLHFVAFFIQENPKSARFFLLRNMSAKWGGSPITDKVRHLGFAGFIRLTQVAEINSLDEHEAVQYEIQRRGYNKYAIRSDAYILWSSFFCMLQDLCQ